MLPAAHGDLGADTQPIVGQHETDSAAPRVVVSGWQRYDNKGRVIEKYEPFFGTGWAYRNLDAAPPGHRVSMRYDPRGQLIRTFHPDGSEQRAIPGVPTTLRTPEEYAPTPWESYHYDANDLAPHSVAPDGTGLGAAAPEAHHFTPASTIVKTPSAAHRADPARRI